MRTINQTCILLCVLCVLGLQGHANAQSICPPHQYQTMDDVYDYRGQPISSRRRRRSYGCSDCAAGYDTDAGNTADSSCSACAAGRYRDSAAESTCIACPAGRYSASTGATNCIACAAGRHTSSTGGTSANSCTTCSAGYYSSSGATTCSSTCPAGHTATSDVACECQAGRYNRDGDDATCIGCSVCDVCASGRFSAYTGSDSCTGSACAAGRYGPVGATTDSDATCSRCARGQYQHRTGQSSCYGCVPGQYTQYDGSTRCSGYACNAGTFGTPNASWSDCRSCPAGQYQSAGGQSACITCDMGYYSHTYGASSSSYCIACGSGLYSTSNGATSSSSCIACTAGYYANANAGASSCIACPVGRYSPHSGASSLSTCAICGEGRTSSAGASSCDSACQAGFYHPTTVGTGNDGNCIACATGWYGTAVGETTPVSACPYNTCPAGTFSAAAGGACTTCAPGSFTTDSSTDNDGHGVRTGASHCNACPPGKINSEGDSTCDVCAPGHFTSSSAGDTPVQTGASHCNRCGAGRFNAEGDATCDGECPAGKFGTVTGSTNVDGCANCNPGLYQPLTAQISCLECRAGHYTAPDAMDSDGTGVITGASHCTGCPVGKYNHAGDSACDTCMAGHFTTNTADDNDGTGVITAATHCNVCPLGRYNVASDASCDGECPAGTFGTIAGMSSAAECTGCGRGQFGVDWGQTTSATCKSCDPGRFATDAGSDLDGVGVAEGATHCNICPAGRYSAGGGSICDRCTPGKFNPVTGATSVSQCQDCIMGSFGTLSGATTSAEACPYSACPERSYSMGSAACATCPVGKFSNGTVRSNADCISCPEGTHVNEIASTGCLVCEPGHFTTDDEIDMDGAGVGTGAAYCIACPAGKFNVVGDDTCELCAPGQFSSVVAASTAAICNTCPVGRFWTEVSLSGTLYTTCPHTACPERTYSSSVAGYCRSCGLGNFTTSSSFDIGFSSGVGVEVGASFCLPCPPGRLGDGGHLCSSPPTAGSDTDTDLDTEAVLLVAVAALVLVALAVACTVKTCKSNSEIPEAVPPQLPPRDLTEIGPLMDKVLVPPVVAGGAMQLGETDVPEKYIAAENQIRIGKAEEATHGLKELMGISGAVLGGFLQDPKMSISREFETHGSVEDKLNLRCVLEGTSRAEWTSRQRLEELVNHEHARTAKLELAHVLALRLYTSSSFARINDPLRTNPPKQPHPFAATTFFIDEGIKKLRAVAARLPNAHTTQVYWRGIKDRGISKAFCEQGGTEFACLSTTASKEVAVSFAASTMPLLFKFETKDFASRGADIAFLSVHPNEQEALYPPLTYLRSIKKPRKERLGGTSMLVITVEPVFM